MGEKETELILEVLKKAFQNYKEIPLDWVISEIHAQSKVYSILYDMYKAPGISVHTSDIAYPEFKNMTPIRLEYKTKDSKGENRRLDIAVLKNLSEIDLDLEKERTIDEMVEFFIEIKVGWGYCSGQFNGEGIIKDLYLMGLYKDKGYLFYFIANEYVKMDEKHKEGYKKSLDYHYKNYSINLDNVFIIFIDGIYKYDINERELKKKGI